MPRTRGRGGPEGQPRWGTPPWLLWFCPCRGDHVAHLMLDGWQDVHQLLQGLVTGPQLHGRHSTIRMDTSVALSPRCRGLPSPAVT